MLVLLVSVCSVLMFWISVIGLFIFCCRKVCRCGYIMMVWLICGLEFFWYVFIVIRLCCWWYVE